MHSIPTTTVEFRSMDLRSQSFIQIFAKRLLAGCLPVTVTLFLLIANITMASNIVIKTNNESLADTEFTQNQLRTIFFSRQTRWPDGSRIRAFVLPDNHPTHVRFSKRILGVYPYQLRAAWDRMLYSGTGVPPVTVKNVDEMRKKIKQIPGAIGYLEE